MRRTLDRHTHLDLLTDGRIHHWTSGQPSRRMIRKRRLVFPMEKMREDPRKCLLHNMHSSDKRSPHLKVPSRPCQRGQRELQGHLCWTWVKRKGLTKVSGMDQLSLLDTMASTTRIAHGLKDDEEVDKTTLSETLNDESITFKHFTVKQVFPRD